MQAWYKGTEVCVCMMRHNPAPDAHPTLQMCCCMLCMYCASLSRMLASMHGSLMPYKTQVSHNNLLMTWQAMISKLGVLQHSKQVQSQALVKARFCQLYK